jgi:hypothetical protein
MNGVVTLPIVAIAVQLLQVTWIKAVPFVPLYQSKVANESALIVLILVLLLLFDTTGEMLAFKQPTNNNDNKIRYIGFIVEYFGRLTVAY